MSQLVDRSARWMYRGLWSLLVDFFRVPKQPPTLPVVQGESIHSFQPAEGFLRYLKFWFWIVLVVTDIAFTAAWLATFFVAWWLGALLTAPAIVLIAGPDIVAFIAIHLRYDTTWYVMTDRSLRIRRGIWTIHEVTITFENVQNIRVRMGPVQRHFGIADLIVETAGGGATQSKHGHGTTGHTGIIEGISNAAEIRDRILARLKQSKTSGLGDEHAEPSRWSERHVQALREIRDEARALGAPTS